MGFVLRLRPEAQPEGPTPHTGTRERVRWGDTPTPPDLLHCSGKRGAAGKEPLWRFSVEEILPFDKLRTLHEQRRKGFSSLEALVAFLRAELASGEEGTFDDEI